MNDIEVVAKKRFLKRYRKNREIVNRLNLKIENLDNRMTRIKSPGFSDMPRGGTPITLEDLLLEKMEIEERKKRLEKRGKRLKVEILEKIDDLEDPRYAEVLEAYFIDYKDFELIAEENGYTLRHVIRLYSEAIDSVVL